MVKRAQGASQPLQRASGPSSSRDLAEDSDDEAVAQRKREAGRDTIG